MAMGGLHSMEQKGRGEKYIDFRLSGLFSVAEGQWNKRWRPLTGILFQIEQEIRPGRSQFSGYRDTFSPQVETRGNLLRMAQFRE